MTSASMPRERRPLGRPGRLALVGVIDRRDHPRRHRSDQPAVLHRIRFDRCVAGGQAPVERDRLAPVGDRVRLHRHDPSPRHGRPGPPGGRGGRWANALRLEQQLGRLCQLSGVLWSCRPVPVRSSTGRPVAAADRVLPDHRRPAHRPDRGGALLHLRRRWRRHRPADPESAGDPTEAASLVAAAGRWLAGPGVRDRPARQRRRCDGRSLPSIDGRHPTPAPLAGGGARLRRPVGRLRLRHSARPGQRRWLRLAPGALRLSLRATGHRHRRPRYRLYEIDRIISRTVGYAAGDGPACARLRGRWSSGSRRSWIR